MKTDDANKVHVALRKAYYRGVRDGLLIGTKDGRSLEELLAETDKLEQAQIEREITG